MQASKMQTSYYGADGSIAPVFSFGRVPLSPSVLTGDGSHMGLWTAVVLHVSALALTITANALFFSNSTESTKQLYTGWAVCSLVMSVLAVLGTVVSTALVRDAFAMPLMNTLLFGLFLGCLLATAKISYLHSVGFQSESAENVCYNLALFFQVFALASIVANGACAISKKGGI